jgi:hypothetical protein
VSATHGIADKSILRVRLDVGLARENVPTYEPSEPTDTKTLETFVESDQGARRPLGLRVNSGRWCEAKEGKAAQERGSHQRMTVYRHSALDYMMSLAHISAN